MIHACINQVPICILSFMHQSHPNCRVHVHSFSLRSLHQPKDGSPHDIELDDFVLATSPCLSNIFVSYSGYDTDGKVNYNDEGRFAADGSGDAELEISGGCGAYIAFPGIVGVTRCSVRNIETTVTGFFPPSKSESSSPNPSSRKGPPPYAGLGRNEKKGPQTRRRRHRSLILAISPPVRMPAINSWLINEFNCMKCSCRAPPPPPPPPLNICRYRSTTLF